MLSISDRHIVFARVGLLYLVLQSLEDFRLKLGEEFLWGLLLLSVDLVLNHACVRRSGLGLGRICAGLA